MVETSVLEKPVLPIQTVLFQRAPEIIKYPLGGGLEVQVERLERIATPTQRARVMHRD